MSHPSHSTPDLPSHVSPPLSPDHPPTYVSPALVPDIHHGDHEAGQGQQPPHYSTIMARVYPYSLRPILIVTSILGAIYTLVIGVGAFQNANMVWTSEKIFTFQAIIGTFSCIVAAIEIYGFGVGIWPRVKVAKALLYLAPLGVVLVFAGQVLKVVLHFAARDDLLLRCEQGLANTTYVDGNGNTQFVTPAQAVSSCWGSWTNNSWTVFAWLVVTTALGIMFASIAITYYRQLQDPTLIRRHQNFLARPQQPDTYQMQPGSYYPPPQREGWEVPPYPGPPAGGAENPFEKGEYHPQAEWAQADPMGYSMPGSNNNDNNNHRAEEEAWARAQAEGPTAHLTAHASPPGRKASGDSDDGSYNGRRAGANV